jgi:hypothetical protein
MYMVTKQAIVQPNLAAIGESFNRRLRRENGINTGSTEEVYGWSAVVDVGNPTMPRKLVNQAGVKTITGKQVTGYSVFTAIDLDAAVAIAKTSPQINGGEIGFFQ